MRRSHFIRSALCTVLTLFLLMLVISRAEMEMPVEPSADVSTAQPGQPSDIEIQRPDASDTPETAEPRQLPDIEIRSWQYILINDLSYSNHLKNSYIPQTVEVTDGIFISEKVADVFAEFMADAEAAGHKVKMLIGYRSYSSQEYIFNGKASIIYDANPGMSYEAAVAKARETVAYPGSSEHQLGLAADIADASYSGYDMAMADSETMKWLTEHCHEYGMILRYPEDKQTETGREYEPWHFRYVGKEAAEYIMAEGICLEEFLALYK